MSWKKILKFNILPEGTDKEEIIEDLELEIGQVMADITNYWFGKYGVQASNDSFTHFDSAIEGIYEAMMNYIKSHKGLEFLDREDLR